MAIILLHLSFVNTNILDYVQTVKPILLYGRHAVTAALANPNRQIIEILTTSPIDNPRQIPLRLVDRSILDKYLPGISHQGIVIRCLPLIESSVLPKIPLDKSSVILILDQIQDPQNIGAIIRSAVAFGVDYILISKNHSPKESGALAKAAAGGLEKISLIRINNLVRSVNELKKQNYFCVALSNRSSQEFTIKALPKRTAFILGAEGKGVRSLIEKNCDFTLCIKILTNSLNVSVAAGIALYAYRLENYLEID